MVRIKFPPADLFYFVELSTTVPLAFRLAINDISTPGLLFPKTRYSSYKGKFCLIQRRKLHFSEKRTRNWCLNFQPCHGRRGGISHFRRRKWKSGEYESCTVDAGMVVPETLISLPSQCLAAPFLGEGPRHGTNWAMAAVNSRI